MNNPVNDHDLQEKLPHLERKLILLSHLENSIKSISKEIMEEINLILNNAMNNNYTPKTINETRGKLFIIESDGIVMEEKIREIIGYPK